MPETANIVRTANKGEWSEIYAFFKILADGSLTGADENLQSIPDKTYDVLRVIRTEKDGSELVTKTYSLSNDHTTISSDNGAPTLTVPLDSLRNGVREIFRKIAVAKGSFTLQEAETLMELFKCVSIKASSADKTDIRLVMRDRFSEADTENGFSIKTAYKAAATLLNASKKNTSFRYRIVRDTAGNSSTSALIDRVRDRVQTIYDAGALIFEEVEGEAFRSNLEFIDSNFPQILASMLAHYYRGAGRTVAELVTLLPDDPTLQNPARSREFYEHKVKLFLEAVALGMTPAKPWVGINQTNGGFIIVRDDGALACYHMHEREKFLDYLYLHTKLDTPSTTRHEYGTIEIDEKGNELIRLNLQIRFI